MTQACGTIKGSTTGVDSAVRTADRATIHGNGRGDVLFLREAIVVDFPMIFQQQRIGGLCRNADSLFVNRLSAAPASTGGIEVQMLEVQMLEVQMLEVRMLVDTGATSSVIAPFSSITAAPAGRKAVSGHTQGVGGSAMTTRKVPNVAMKLAGGEATVSLTVGNSTLMCGEEGLLGMDALRGCRLVLVESAFAWTCHPVL